MLVKIKVIKQWKGASWSWSYCSWIYNYLCNQGLSALMLWVRIALRWGVIDTTLCDKVCQWLAAGWWFSLGTPVSSTNKTECHDITEILLKVALNTITLSLPQKKHIWYLGSHIRLFALVSDNCWLFKYFLKEFLKKICYQANTFI